MPNEILTCIKLGERYYPVRNAGNEPELLLGGIWLTTDQFLDALVKLERFDEIADAALAAFGDKTPIHGTN